MDQNALHEFMDLQRRWIEVLAEALWEKRCGVILGVYEEGLGEMVRGREWRLGAAMREL